jgi:hypothetical protein
MPYAIRRCSDGQWFRRTGSSSRSLVAELEKASTWASPGPAKAAARHAVYTLGDESELEIVELITQPVRVVEVVKLHAHKTRGLHGAGSITSVTKAPRQGFRHVDSE